MDNAGNRSEDFAPIPSLGLSLLTGSLGFGSVSLFVFATVAYAETWMYEHLGFFGSYLTWIVLFILLGGGVLAPLVVGRWQMPKFYLLFAGAFFAYAAGWISAYFILGGVVGEWMGSLVGSVVMGLVLATGFGVARPAWSLLAILFIANSVGYFLGSALNDSIPGKAGMIFWGLIYGVCLGAGLGAVLHFAQVRAARTS
jgi:hypothetical protein